MEYTSPMQPLTTPSHYTPCHYSTNRALLDNASVNVTFDAVLRMSDEDWTAWLERMRHAVLTAWDTDNVPPRVGMTDAEIADAWDKFAAADASSVWTVMMGQKLCWCHPQVIPW
jgi:hypothetical protein